MSRRGGSTCGRWILPTADTPSMATCSEAPQAMASWWSTAQAATARTKAAVATMPNTSSASMPVAWMSLLNSVSDRGWVEGHLLHQRQGQRFVPTPVVPGDALAAVKWARDNGYAAGRIGCSVSATARARASGSRASQLATRDATRTEGRRPTLPPSCWCPRLRGFGPVQGGCRPLGNLPRDWGSVKDENQPAACVNFFPEASRRPGSRTGSFPTPTTATVSTCPGAKHSSPPCAKSPRRTTQRPTTKPSMAR